MNSTLLLTLLLAVAAAYSLPTEDFTRHVEEEWTKFKETYGRVFAKPELEMSRKATFEKNLRNIYRHNLLYSRGMKTHNLAVNQFTDLTKEEFKQMVGGIRKPANFKRNGNTFMTPLNLGELPDKVDWRDEGLVAPVKNQFHCGSCWAFSAVGAIEGQHARKTGQLVILSEQNLVDCSKGENDGCHGGLMDTAFQYVIKSHGIDTAESYPYEAIDGKCRFNNMTVGATISGFVDIQEGDEQKLKEALATVGPISIAIDDSDPNFSFLGGDGIYQYDDCSTQNLGHAILLIGYGTENGQDYWLIKNSWGDDWGNMGYLKMARNRGNMCGIATSASYPVV